MTERASRSFVVCLPGELGGDEYQHLAASGIRWKGRYESLQAGWRADGDTPPWETRQVLQVQARDSDAAVQQVADVLGRPASLAGT